jgi:hypothetical protein
MNGPALTGAGSTLGGVASSGLLPGHEIVDPGLADLQAGVLSDHALAVLAAAPRLRRAGVDVPFGFDELMASHELYERLAVQLGNAAHSRHHALIRRVVSYAATASAVPSDR